MGYLLEKSYVPTQRDCPEREIYTNKLKYNK